MAEAATATCRKSKVEIARDLQRHLITLAGLEHVGINIRNGAPIRVVLATHGNFEVATRDVEDIFIDTRGGR